MLSLRYYYELCRRAHIGKWKRIHRGGARWDKPKFLPNLQPDHRIWEALEFV